MQIHDITIFFDYSKFEYINAKTKGIIICPEHGEFLQCPDKHLNGTVPCPMCLDIYKNNILEERWEDPAFKEKIRKINREKPKSLHHASPQPDLFLDNIKKKFGNKFEIDISNFNGTNNNKIKIKCPIHGWFEKRPNSFLICSYGCTQCAEEAKQKAKIKSYDNFTKQINSFLSTIKIGSIQSQFVL